MHRPDGCMLLDDVKKLLLKYYDTKLPTEISNALTHLHTDTVNAVARIKIRVGDHFQLANKSLSDTVYHLVGACKASPKGPCCLASLEYGWSYTGKMVVVENTHDISLAEFEEITEGHEFVRLDDHRKKGG